MFLLQIRVPDRVQVDMVINSRAVVFKMESVRLGRRNHFKTFGYTGKISIRFVIHFHSEYYL